MWLSSASRFSAPVKQQGVKQPFNQRCPLLCEASNSLPAQSLRDKHRVTIAVGGHTFTKANKKVPQTLSRFLSLSFHKQDSAGLYAEDQNFVVKLHVYRRTKANCAQTRAKQQCWCVAIPSPTSGRTWWKLLWDCGSFTWFNSWCQRISRWWSCALLEEIYNQKNQNPVS